MSVTFIRHVRFVACAKFKLTVAIEAFHRWKFQLAVDNALDER
jgi:hypothetical protein